MSITLEEITRYLGEHPDQMSREKNLFPPEKIMMLINPKNLDKLKLEFQGHPLGLPLQSFLWLMSNVIDHKLEERYELLYSLTKLFKEIDINMSKTIEWRQLISYVIQQVKAHTQRPPTTITLQKPSKSKQLQAAIVLKPPAYEQSKQLQGKDSDLSSLIKKILIIDSLKVISMLSVRMTSVKMYSDQDLHFKPEYTLEFSDQNIVDYEVGNNCILLLGNKQTVKFYDIDPEKLTIKWKNKQTFLIQPLKIWYLPFHNLFLTTDHQYKIRNIVKPIRRFDNGYITQTEICFTAHTSMITNIQEIKTPYSIVTSSMDGRIKMWDVFKGEIIAEIVVTSAVKAVKNIGVVDGSIIYSWGYDNFIQMWIPDKSMIKPYVGELDVKNMVIDVCTVFGQGIIISLDCKNILKVWQIRKLECIQTIQASKSAGILPFKKSFITFNCTITFYNRKNELKILDEDKIPLGGFFNFTYSSFIVVAPKEIRSYDAKTGLLKALYNYSVHHEQQSSISCFMKTQNHRKLYIGDKDGNVTIFNSETGEVLRRVKDGDVNNQIESLIYINSQNTILAGSSKLQSFDQEDGITTSLIKDVSLPHEVRHIDYNQNLKAFLLTSTKGYSIWSFETFKLMYDEEIDIDIVEAKWIEGFYGFVVVVRGYFRVYSITHDLRVNPQWVKDFVLPNECSVAITIQHKMILPKQALDDEGEKEKESQKEQISGEEREPKEKKKKDKEKEKEKMEKKEEDPLLNLMEGVNVYSYFGEILKVSPLIMHSYLVLGFITGQVGLINLTLTSMDIHLVSIQEPYRMTSFQFRRKEYIKQKFKDFKYIKQPKLPSSQASLFHTFPTHSTPISSISYTEQIDCFTVCGQDQLIKVISFTGSVHCIVDAFEMKASKWSLPFSWIDLKLEEMNEVITVAQIIGDKQIAKSNKEELKSRTLSNMYFQEKEAFNLLKYGYRPEMEMLGRESPTKEYKVKKAEQTVGEDQPIKINRINSQLQSKLELRIDSRFQTKYGFNGFTSRPQHKTKSLFKSQSNSKPSIDRITVTKQKQKLDNRINPNLLRQEKVMESPPPSKPILRMSLKQFRRNNGIKVEVPTNFMKATLSTKFLKAPELDTIRSRTLSKRSLRQQQLNSNRHSNLLKQSLRLPDEFWNIDDRNHLEFASPSDLKRRSEHSQT